MSDFRMVRIMDDEGKHVEIAEKPEGYRLTVNGVTIERMEYSDFLKLFRLCRMMFPPLANREFQ